ncbi:hypothetical protein EDB89DRAFT_1315142 [Lactarius sanguifluus]|nr:hypothetical protein EDB89DRAFT_1315142 [Lactarius sanguifluus]
MTAAGSNDSLPRRGILDLLHFWYRASTSGSRYAHTTCIAVPGRTCRSSQRQQPLNRQHRGTVIRRSTPATLSLTVGFKLSVCFGVVGANIFPISCAQMHEQKRPTAMGHSRARNRITELMWAPNTHSRAIADPRVSSPIVVSPRMTRSLKLQKKALAIVAGDHLFINASALETEGVTLLQRLITALHASSSARGASHLSLKPRESLPPAPFATRKSTTTDTPARKTRRDVAAARPATTSRDTVIAQETCHDATSQTRFSRAPLRATSRERWSHPQLLLGPTPPPGLCRRH